MSTLAEVNEEAMAIKYERFLYARMATAKNHFIIAKHEGFIFADVLIPEQIFIHCDCFPPPQWMIELPLMKAINEAKKGIDAKTIVTVKKDGTQYLIGKSDLKKQA